MNVDWMFHLPAPIRRMGYFGLQQLIGSQIGRTWSEFQSWEKLSAKELNAAVESRLSGLLNIATSQSAYYRNLGLVRQASESGKDFLQRFPPLTREKVREHFAEIVIDPLRDQIKSPASVAGKRYDWLVVKTGGTTGVPTAVVHDARCRDWGRATRLFAQRLSGFPLGTPYFRLWGSEQDLLQQKEKLDRRVLRNLLGEIPMNAFRAKEEALRKHYETLREHSKIRHLMAYVDAAINLADFIEDHSLPRIQLDSVMACAGTVTPEWRQRLQETFGAQVFDKYGSRECSDIACECKAHRGLHVFSPAVYVEIVDEAGNPCSPGEQGKILVTLLNNQSFPMIRYNIGDLGIWAEEEDCSCGLPYPKIKSLQGRQDDMLTTEDGTFASSVFIRHFVGVSLNRHLIQEWQLEQTAAKEFKFRYIPIKNDGLAQNLTDLKESFHKTLGRTCTFHFEQVKEIPPSATGKVRWIVNSWKSRSREKSLGA